MDEFLLAVPPDQDITAALKAAFRDHRVVRIPAGNYTIGRVDVPSGGALYGYGPDATILHMRTPSSKGGLNVDNQRDVRFAGFAVDIHATANFATAIAATKCEGLEVGDVHLFTSELPDPAADPEPPTIHAVLARGARDVDVHDSRITNAQVKVNGGTEGARVRDCRFFGSHNFAISAVGVDPRQVTRRITIERNSIESPFSGGIYVGADGDKATGSELHALVVRRNLIFTTPEPHPTEPGEPWTRGILGRVGSGASNWTFEENTVRPHDPARKPIFGIIIKTIDVNPAPITGLRLVRNVCMASDHADMTVHIAGGDVLIDGFYGRGGRGLELAGAGIVEIRNGDTYPGAVSTPGLTLISNRGGVLRTTEHDATNRWGNGVGVREPNGQVERTTV